MDNTNSICIVGCGPAGLSTAYYLSKSSIFDNIILLEQNNFVGGRTKSIYFNKNYDSTNEEHILDTGAGWLTSFYHSTFSLIKELGLEDILQVRAKSIRGASEIMKDDNSIDILPLSIDSISSCNLLTTEEQNKLIVYIKNLLISEENELNNDLLSMNVDKYDNKSALDEYKNLGDNVIKYIMSPLFEGPFFCQLNQLSAAMTNSWIRALFSPNTELYQVNKGMNAICIEMAKKLRENNKITFLLEHQVKQVHFIDINNLSKGIHVNILNKQNNTIVEKIFDCIVLAMPSDNIKQILSKQSMNILKYEYNMLKDIFYTPHVRIYAARKSNENVNFGYHLVPTRTPIATIEYFSSNYGAWGYCPKGYQWALVCATSEKSKEFLSSNYSDDFIANTLWDKAQNTLPQLFSLSDAEIIHVVRWHHAIPILGPKICKLTQNYHPKPPILLAGDWSVQPCVEGAICSGKRVAKAIINAKSKL